MKKNLPQIFATQKEIAKMFSTSPETVRGWMRAGLPYYQYNKNDLHFDVEDVRKWVKENRKPKEVKAYGI